MIINKHNVDVILEQSLVRIDGDLYQAVHSYGRDCSRCDLKDCIKKIYCPCGKICRSDHMDCVWQLIDQHKRTNPLTIDNRSDFDKMICNALLS